MAKTVEQLLDEARAGIERLSPAQAFRAQAEGALLLDIRSEKQRSLEGAIPGARHVPRNVLEWRLDPSSASRDETLARPEALIVVVCDEGFQSSLAAATLRQLGLGRATDLAGGFRAWRSAGLPVEAPEAH